MPWGLRRLHHSGRSHFVTFCCYHRRRLFTTDASRRIFESALERVRRSFRLQVYGYVLCRSMFICCLANRNGSRPAIGLPRSGQKRAWVGDPPQVCRFSCPYGTWLGFSPLHPALKRRAIFRTSSGRWVRFSRALRDMVGFLGIAPGVETPGYYQTSSGRCAPTPPHVTLCRESPICDLMRIDVCVRRTPDDSPAFQRRVRSSTRNRIP
jgi:hypothetical protein